MDDSSDILGGQLNVARQHSLFSWSGISFSSLFTAIVAVLAAFYGLQLVYPHYRQYQEKRYRKSMRRRHGIPDNDHRPFNVAYAAAKQALKEREAEAKGLSKRSSAAPSIVGGSAARQHVSAAPGQAPRPRQAAASSAQPPSQRRDTEEVPQSRSNYVESRRASGQTTTASESDHHISGVPQDSRSDKLAPAGSSSSLYAPAFTRSVAPETTHGKRTLDDENMGDEGPQESKKSRVEDRDNMDNDEDAEWQGAEADVDDDMEVDEASPAQPKRGAKRLASLEEDEGFESSRAIGRDKRARKVSNQELMMKAMRGKKRGRTEAGSTFGGDDSIEDEIEDNHRSQRRRRITNKRSIRNLQRGQKRGREPDSLESDDESNSPSRRAARYKRGKRSPREEDWTSDDGMISNDPLCKGRHIGEEWETNGVKYKVGPNGQRLRQALVKKSRSRFPMPKDSEHPDRKANIDVYVETWLSEEEYQNAKDRNELAWQSPPNSVIDLPVTTDVPESPSKGKNLLWSSTAHKDTRKLPLAKSLTPNGSLRINPFQHSQGALVRRISTIFAPTPTVPESPKLTSSRSYSKWEKQDLEAAAMAKLREKVKQDAVLAAPQKKTVTFDVPSVSTSAPDNAPGGSGPSVKSTEPAASKPMDAPKTSATLSFGNPAAAGGTQPTKASTSDLPSLTIPSSTPKPTEPPKPSTVPFPSGSSTTAEPAKIAAAVPPTSTPFSFGNQPASQPATTSTQPSAPAVPNFFAKPTAPAASSAPNPFGGAFGQSNTASQNTSTPNIFGSSGQSTSAPSLQSASGTSGQPAAKPVFSFGGSAPSSIEKPEVKPTQPPQTSTTSGPSLLSRMGGFGGNPATSNTASNVASSSNPASQTSHSFAQPAAPTSSFNSAAPSESNAPVKFSFGVTSKPATAPTATTSGSDTAPAADAPKPATLFNFGGATTPAATSNSATTAPKTFGFGAPPAATTSGPSGTSGFFGNTNGSSAFGAMSTAPKDAPATPNAKPTSTFVFPKTPANGSAFGGTSTTPAGTPSGTLFGNVKPAPSTPANGSAFADNMSTTPAGTPPTGSAFGNTPATTTPAGPPPPAKSMFNFGAAGGNTASGSGAPLFGNASKPAASAPVFGQPSSFTTPSNPSSTSGASSSAPTFPFGAPSTANGSAQGPSATASDSNAPKFSFAAGNNTANSNSAMGVSAPSSGTTQPKTTFTFGNSSMTSGAAPAFGSTAFGSTNATAGSSNGTGQPTPNMFGFGGPSTFGFGQSKPPESNQK